jgi:O-antigen ligase
MTSIAYGALWLFVFSMPWETMLVLPGIGLANRAFGMAAAGLSVLAVIMSGRFRKLHAFFIAGLLFLIWAGLGLFLYHSGERLPHKFWTFAQLLLFAWMVWQLAPSRKAQVGLMLAYILGCYVAAFDTILLLRSAAAITKRLAAGGGDSNDFAMTLALAIPMAWHIGMTDRRAWIRLLCRGYLPVALVALGLSGSRGGMIASMVGLLIVPLSMHNLSPGKLVTAIVVLGASGALAIAYTPETMIERLGTAGSEVASGGLSGRLKLWKAGLRVYEERPIFGYGSGYFKNAITPILGTASQVAHNSYISLLVEEGIVGWLLYMTMLAMVFINVMALPPPERRFGLVLLATLMTAMLPLTWEDRRPTWFVMASLLGFACSHRIPGPAPVRGQVEPEIAYAGSRPRGRPAEPALGVRGPAR